MNNIFYNVVSIIIGIALIFFGAFNMRKHKILFSIFIFIHAVLFLLAGIGGFFLPDKYQYITILAMLALCITMAIVMLLLKKEDKNKKDKTTAKALK